MRARRTIETLATLGAVIMLAGSAAAASADRIQRLPRVAPGTLLPSARGVVLGKTTKGQLLARWGPATDCPPIVHSCRWVVGLGKDFFPEPGGVSDEMTVVFHATTGRAATLSLTTSSWRKSRLRGWKLPGGVGIGSPFRVLRREYPTLRWSSGVATTRDGSVWLVVEHEVAGEVYRLRFTVDAGAARASTGHVYGLDIVRLLPRIACRLTAEPALAPADAVAGIRVRGSCSPPAEYAASSGLAVPLPISFSTSGGAQIVSASSPFDSSCRPSRCAARASDWAVDVRLGLSRADARLEAVVDVRSVPGAEPDGPAKLRIPLG